MSSDNNLQASSVKYYFGFIVTDLLVRNVAYLACFNNNVEWLDFFIKLVHPIVLNTPILPCINASTIIEISIL